ncbi:MAG: SH3 domain-containing protein [Acidobacteria bacterium]|nr:SH3 domain-containing protein [Acidobacteriota bacterium]
MSGLSLRTVADAGEATIGNWSRMAAALGLETSSIPVKPSLRRTWLIVVGSLALLSACTRGHKRVLEIDYVSAPQVVLRDQLSQVYNKVGAAKNGDRVAIVDRERRFARVRTEAGAEGWVEQRYLVNQQVFDSFQRLAAQEKNAPVEATATTRNETNLHLEPGRDSEHLYQLAQGGKVYVFERATVEKSISGNPQAPVPGAKEANSMEDWWLVRDEQDHVGWVLGRMIDVDIPLEVAQYAEGRRIVAYFVLNQVTEGEKKVPQYLVLMTEAKDGLPFDFNQARVFTWNVRRHRYETAYRERNLNGVLPVAVSHEIFGTEGDLPTFILRAKDADGNVVERKYKMNTPIVRRVGGGTDNDSTERQGKSGPEQSPTRHSRHSTRHR